MSEAAPSIAIVGMAGRFPDAESVDELWHNLLAGREAITRFSAEQLDPSIAAELRDHPRYVPARGVVADADRFDAAFFGIPPREALLMDPQQRVFLELCWNALEDTGVDPQRFDGSIGVYAGTANNGYRKLVESRADLVQAAGEFATMLANEKDYVATRVAHRLDLTGPALSIHTACSTSLVAITQAWYALMSWQCDLALAGGINLTVPQASGYLPVEGGMESIDGHCRPFDAAANGTVFSSGGAAVVLKRTADALAAGDTIYAVIRGVGVNNDGGDKASFSAPSVRGQAAVIGQALACAGVAADSIGYVEAHGTATALGDPIEVAALTRAFGARAAGQPRCLLGSIKGNLGHLNAASGVTGLIKAALALHHGRIPATLHFRAPNPEIDFAASPFAVVDQTVEWPAGQSPRRAGVSSFGVGGTNAHAVLEEAPPREPLSETGASSARPYVLLPLSARDALALQRRADALAATLAEAGAPSLADIGYTLALGRQPMPLRGVAVAATGAQACTQLAALTVRTATVAPGVVFLFPGQGSQHANMARALVASEPVFAAAFENACALASRLLDRDLRALILPAAGDEAEAETALAQTRYTQPALFAVEYALADLWESWGVVPAAMIGHSIGEYVAACRAGVFSLDDALALVVARGAAMFAQPPGAMLAVRLGAAELGSRLPTDVAIAGFNTPELTVISGAFAAIDAVATALRDEGIAASRLRVSHAFHSAMMEPALALFRRAFDGVRLNPPRRPFYSCVTGAPITPADAVSPDYWCRQLRAPVRFADAVLHALAQAPVSALLLEVGPSQALTSLTRRMLAGRGQAIASLGAASAPGDAAEQLQRALGEAWCAGVKPDWTRYYAGQQRQRVRLPGYPFHGERYWIDAGPASAATATTPAQTHGLVASAHEAIPAIVATHSSDLRELIENLSGEHLTPAHDADSFLQLGLDSLALTQATLELERRFGVKLKFRRLMEDLNCVNALAAWLDDQLPAAAVGLAEQIIPTGNTAPTALDDTAPASLLERPFGASARIVLHSHDQLDPAQRAWVTQFAAAYNARTAGSKAFSQQHRALMADPRVVTGFNPLWKELAYPIVVERSRGARLWDVDGREYIDLLNGFGVNFLGYQPDCVVDALHAQVDAGVEIGPQHPLAAEVSRLISDMTGMSRVALCNTGSEAVMGAMRVARTVTGRKTIAIFRDSYHGIFDEVIVRGSRTLRSIAAAPGILASAVENVLVLDYGSDEALRILRERAHELAAVVIEPVQSRNPTLQPRAFVQALRTICDDGGCALIFDEVITGFRMAPGGAQEVYGVRADLASYGKIIGGGLPLAAIAGSAHWMDALDGGHWQFGDDSYPEAGVTYFAGTFVRHPLALAAGRAALTFIQQQGSSLQAGLNANTAGLIEQLNALFRSRHAPLEAIGYSSLWRIRADENQPFASLLWYRLRHEGLHVYEQFNCFLSLAHGPTEVAQILAAVGTAVDALMQAGLLTPRPVETLRAAVEAPIDEHAEVSVPLPTELPSEFPLTEGQLEKWLACQYGEQATVAFNESLLLQLHGELDVYALRHALAIVWSRHEAFGLHFDADGKHQRIEAGSPMPWIELDYCDDGQHAEANFIAWCETQMRQPFDLARAPLLRFALARLGPQRHGLQMLAHHLVMDGWSAGVWMGEVAQCYNACRAGMVPVLPPAESLRAWVLNECARHGADSHRLDYWKTLYTVPPASLQLPADRPAPARADFSAATERHEFSPALTAALRAEARRRGVSLYSLMLSGFAVLLAQLSGQDDFAVGVPFAAQAAAGCGALIGDGVNTLPLRLNILPEEPLAALIARTHAAVLDATEHQDTTLMSILRALRLHRRDSNAPLTGVVFNLNPRLPGIAWDGLAVAVRECPRAALMWDLFFNLSDTGDTLTLDLHYSTARRDAATIQGWIGNYQALLGAIAQGKDDQVNTLPMHLSVATAIASVDAAVTPAPAPAPTPAAVTAGSATTFPALFAAQLARAPQRIAVECEGRALSYAELDRRATLIAQALRARGVGKGELVGIAMPRSEQLLAALLGVMKSGAAYLPLDPAFPSARLDYMATHARLQHVVVESAAVVPAAIASGRQLLAIAELDTARLASEPLPLIDTADPVYVLYTSGSTGQPKGVCVSHGNLANLLCSMRTQPGLAEDDVLCAVTTLSFDIAGLELYLPLLVGARVLLASDVQQRDPTALLWLIREYGASVLQTTPTLARLLLDADHDATLRPLRLLLGGEVLPRELADRLLTGSREVWNFYGPTETTIWSTVARVEPGVGVVPIGQPIANTRIHVLDEAGQPVKADAIGDIWIGGAGVADGYLHRRDLTDERFRVDPFAADGSRMYCSGDRGSFHDGALHFHGRADQQIKLRGHRIEAGEIEAVAMTEPGIREVAARVHDFGANDQRLVLHAVARAHDPALGERLRQRLHKQLPAYMLPQHIEWLSELPRTANGKLDRNALHAPISASATDRPNTAAAGLETAGATDPGAVGPRTAVLMGEPREHYLATLWRELIGIEDVRGGDNFFDLGGHSLLAVEFATRVQRETGVRLPLLDIATGTLASLAVELPAARVATTAAPAFGERLRRLLRLR